MRVALPAPAGKQQVRSRQTLRIILGAPAFLLLGVVIFLWYIGLLTGNIRTVVPGRVYRSAQLSAADLSRLIEAKGIRTVISLRGGDEGDSWFRQEAEACRRAGAALHAVRLRATALPRPKELRKLLALFDSSDYPLLFHCRGGADRSGLAAALYLNVYQSMPLKKALDQGLTWRYGHFKVTAGAMDRFFQLFQQNATGSDLRTWIVEQYPSVYTAEKRRRRDPSGAESSCHRLPPAGGGITGLVHHTSC